MKNKLKTNNEILASALAIKLIVNYLEADGFKLVFNAKSLIYNCLILLTIEVCHFMLQFYILS